MNASEIYNCAVEKYYSAHTPSDKKHALKGFENAAHMGFDLAMLRAGEMYFFGDGIQTSRKEGLRWISKACEVSEHYNDLYIQDPKTGNFLDVRAILHEFS